MLDEKERETSREDALSAYESLFGDEPADPPDADAEDQDSKSETGQDRQDSGVAEGQAAGDETSPPEERDNRNAPTPPDELKVVVSIRDGRATIGVQQPSSDPHIELVDDPDLSGLAVEVPAVVERARARWEDAPKHPAHTRPAPSNRRRPRREQGAAQASAGEGAAERQQPEAPRLF